MCHFFPLGTVILSLAMQSLRDIFCICRLSRLLLIANETTGGLLEDKFSFLEDRLQELYHRPYLAKGSAERALILLKALLQVAVVALSLTRYYALSWKIDRDQVMELWILLVAALSCPSYVVMLLAGGLIEGKYGAVGSVAKVPAQSSLAGRCTQCATALCCGHVPNSATSVTITACLYLYRIGVSIQGDWIRVYPSH